MILLKNYQQQVLDSLREFFQQCAKDGKSAEAFMNVQRQRGLYPDRYLAIEAAGLSDIPYVCARVPTGGGKTLIACHTAGLAISDYVRAERAVVLWLVPSNTILEQTADALRNPHLAYRRALELSCGQFEVVTINEALQLSRAEIDGQTVIIVATIQSFRAEDTNGRRVYGENGLLMEHFLNIPADQADDLWPGADGKPKTSLANVLRLRRPVVIVDEAHNARTDLSFTTLGNLLPSCIIEFTATPDRRNHPSNVLHRVSAAELKAEHMIKLPLKVITREASQKEELLAEAVSLRADLERLAAAEGQQTGEYIRPILLIQAERVDACGELREHLVNNYSIPREQIKISTGALDELKSIPDIDSQKCPVRLIITVEKLREGWDCPFAYVLCSLKETHSATAIEQIVGRILRLPNAELKRHPELNCAYAFSVSRSMPEVLNELRQALESNGFTAAEAERIVLPASQGVLPMGAQGQRVQLKPGKDIDVGVAQIQANVLAGKVQFDAAKGEFNVLVPLDEAETERLLGCAKTLEARAKLAEAVTAVATHEKAFGGTGLTRVPTPYELHLEFAVPLLCVVENGNLFEFEKTHLMERPWKLSSKDASLSESYNPFVRSRSKTGTVDVSGTGTVEVSTANELPEKDYVSRVHQSAMELGAPAWTLESLTKWLDQRIEHRDIPADESGAFLVKAIRGLMTKFGIEDVSVLGADRFRLRDEIESRIEEHRASERVAAFQQYLLSDEALEVSHERALDFRTIEYAPSYYYTGAFQFRKHYFPPQPGELPALTPSGEVPEECLCAQFIDGMPEVKYWVRNLQRKPGSFRLQTSKDWFYPDFICRLNDGRTLVVEYKGEYIYDASDATEKRAIGEVWASRSKGKCLFVMPTKGDLGAITRKVLGF